MMLPQAPWQDEPQMRRLLKVLGSKDGETRFVGGCVRDVLATVPVTDIDLATRLLPEEVMRRLEDAGIKAVPTGLAHGTVTAVIQGRPVEVTTLRRDVSTDGRRATVAFTCDWQEDAARRDFTINAMSADPESRQLFDYYGGADDLRARRVRFIGDPLTRIAEDHLRILRFFRFHARFGAGSPDREGLEACAARANDLMALSRERIAGELMRILGLPDPAPTLRVMVDRTILAPVLPEITENGVDRLATLVVREAAADQAPDAARRLAAMLPKRAIAADIAARLRLSNAIRNRLLCIEKNGLDDLGDPALLAYQLGRECAIDRLLLAQDLDDASAAERIATLTNWQRPKLNVSGGDLVAMGLPEGPLVAQVLKQIEREWGEIGFPADASIARDLARRAVDQALRARQ